MNTQHQHHSSTVPECNSMIRKPSLTSREVEVLRAWVVNDSKHAAARQLYIAQSTVSTHISRIRGKYECVGRPANSKATLLARALQDGHVSLDEL